MPKPQLKPLREQVVVVMGASSGIGRATAAGFAAQGAKVVVAARGEAGLRSLVEEIRAGGGEACAEVADVTDPAQVRRERAGAGGAQRPLGNDRALPPGVVRAAV